MNKDMRLYSYVEFSDLKNLPGYSVVLGNDSTAWQYVPYVQDDEGEWSYSWSSTVDPLARVQEFDGPFLLVYFPDEA